MGGSSGVVCWRNPGYSTTPYPHPPHRVYLVSAESDLAPTESPIFCE